MEEVYDMNMPMFYKHIHNIIPTLYRITDATLSIKVIKREPVHGPETEHVVDLDLMNNIKIAGDLPRAISWESSNSDHYLVRSWSFRELSGDAVAGFIKFRTERSGDWSYNHLIKGNGDGAFTCGAPVPDMPTPVVEEPVVEESKPKPVPENLPEPENHREPPNTNIVWAPVPDSFPEPPPGTVVATPGHTPEVVPTSEPIILPEGEAAPSVPISSLKGRSGGGSLGLAVAGLLLLRRNKQTLADLKQGVG
jgi:hypothetical protein